MSASLNKHGEILKFLGRAKPNTVKPIIKAASPELVRALCECCHNVLKGNVRVTPAQKKRLSRHKRNLRALVQRKTSLKKRKQILQEGGFIGALLGPVLSVLKGVLGI